MSSSPGPKTPSRHARKRFSLRGSRDLHHVHERIGRGLQFAGVVTGDEFVIVERGDRSMLSVGGFGGPDTLASRRVLAVCSRLLCVEHLQRWVEASELSDLA